MKVNNKEGEEMTQETGITTRNIRQELPMPISQQQAMYLLRTIWPDAPETDVIKAAIICRQYALNPLMKQVHLVKFDKKDRSGNVIGVSWEVILGIRATRQIAQQALRREGRRYSFFDGPRVMTEDEQKQIRGKVEPGRIWAIVKLQDSDGLIYPGYGWWPADKQPYGSDKGNDPVNMAFIRAERNATDKMAPGALPDLDTGDSDYAVGNFQQAIEAGKQEFNDEVDDVIDAGWPDDDAEPAPEPPAQPEEPPQELIPLDWLREQLQVLKWTQVCNWIKGTMGITGKTVTECVEQMNEAQARQFVKEIEERLKMV